MVASNESRADLLNINTIILSGLTARFSSWPTLATMVVVLPDPATALTRACPPEWLMIQSCSSVRFMAKKWQQKQAAQEKRPGVKIISFSEA